MMSSASLALALYNSIACSGVIIFKSGMLGKPAKLTRAAVVAALLAARSAPDGGPDRERARAPLLLRAFGRGVLAAADLRAIACSSLGGRRCHSTPKAPGRQARVALRAHSTARSEATGSCPR